jgi:uncharacterized membrane protein
LLVHLVVQSNYFVMVNDEKEPQKTPEMAAVVERNIRALVDRRRHEERQKPIEERIADKVTGFTGNMAFVYTHAVGFGIWILLNVGWFHLKPFDSDLLGLQVFASLEAIFLSTFVLMSQNSLDAQADKRADLDLQISLLAEHEITRLIGLVTAIANKLDIQEAKDPEINELAKDVVPEKVMDTMENTRNEDQRS